MFEWLKPLLESEAGPALYLAFTLLFIIIFGGLLFAIYRFAAPSGAARHAAQMEENKTSAKVLEELLAQQRIWYESQIADLKREHEAERQEDRMLIASLQGRVESLEARMRDDEGYNREYRHVLANRENALGFMYDNAVDLIDAMLDECGDAIPSHFRRQRRLMKSADDMRLGHPLPIYPLPALPAPQHAGIQGKDFEGATAAR